ncbi:hypothetical protein KEH56_10100 [Burkholderia cenocepacia]|uniref:hypothetical protein n=1 Tax=Burkholderia cenocepacia TaxID=95486 RepID=UPI001BAA4925|nr:hypothetical protein [Burkholderia cenocepacia]QUN38588.1 hypothetical protein KEH56_10100 [Burkholderia cenocepacia]QUO29512.1 hypothetical protein KEH57_23875 [Burkholderia cenocepacia]
MKTYARIDSGVVQEILQTDGDIKKMFHPALVWVDITTETPSPQPGWSAVKSAGSWSFVREDTSQLGWPAPPASVTEIAGKIAESK